MSNTHAFDAAAALQLGQEVLTQEAGALTHLASTLGSEFTDAVSRILSCKGRLIVSGVGKSATSAASSPPPLPPRAPPPTSSMPLKPPTATSA